MEIINKENEIKNIGSMEFWLKDYRETEFNESVDVTFELYGVDDELCELMSIEKYWCLCRDFAAAMGFSETTINEWFGEY